MADSYYNVLNISTSATQRDIKVAYRKLVQEHHPDVNNSSDDERIKLINIAYETLSDPVKKSTYDNRLLGGFESDTFTQSYSAPYQPRARRPPPNYYKGGRSSSQTYTFSLKTQLIGWTATILVLMLVVVGIYALHFFVSEYYYEEALEAEKNNDLEGALSLYQLAIRDWGSKSVAASIKSAELSRELGAFYYMIDFCKKGLNYEPDTVQTAKLFYLQALAYNHTERFKKAEKAYLNSLRFKFNKDTIYLELGPLYINQLNEFKKAEQIYTYLLSGNSIDLTHYYNRGISYQYLGKHVQAIEDFQQVLKDNPYSGKILFQLGRSHLALGQTELACEYLRFAKRQSINIDPADLAKACE